MFLKTNLKRSIFSICRFKSVRSDVYSQTYWSVSLPSSPPPPPTCPFLPAPEVCLLIRSRPSCGASLGGSRWIPTARSPHLTDAWAPWTWWPSVWGALWERGSMSCLERWPGTPRGPASSSAFLSPPWPPYSQGCAMRSLGLGFLKQARRTSTAMWPWESCWPSSLDGICCFLMS